MVVRPIEGRVGGIYWYVLQTYGAARIAFSRYLRLIQNTEIFKDKNRSELWVKLSNDAVVHFKSGKNFEDLRAETLDGCVIDEVRQQDSNLWPMIIRPMLSRRKAWCYFLSTTNGFDHFKDLCDFAEAHPEAWGVFVAPSWEAYWWTPEEIESARSTMSQDVFDQELGAEFKEVGVGKAYKAHHPANSSLTNPFTREGLWSPYLPIIVGLDFNVGLMVWELAQRKGTDFYFGDEIAIENTDTEECAKVLIEKVKDHKAGVILVGDASGNSRKTSAVGKTDYSIIKKLLTDHGIYFEDRTPTENPMVKDRVNCINSGLKSADGSVHLRYHPINCKYLKRDFERVKWKQGTGGAILDKSDPLATHASDAAGYPICVFADVFKSKPGVMRTISR